MAAIRRLAHEAEFANQISSREGRGIDMIKFKSPPNTRHGHWLTVDGCKQLLALPNRNTLLGRRNAALLGLLLGCGLRRAEAVGVTWAQYQLEGDRMILADVLGKGGRIRTLPVPEWARRDIDGWHEALILHFDRDAYAAEQGESETQGGGPILRSLVGSKHGYSYRPCRPLTDSGVESIIAKFGASLGIHLGAHDLRRTMAKLMRDAGIPLEQIQFMLGHTHLLTTEKYLGGRLDLRKGTAAVDKTGIE